MPAPNDLTPEEEAEFARHGVPSAGPGREPLGEAPQQGQQQQGQQQQEQQGGEQRQGDEGQQQGRQTFHREDGRFASREEREQGQARPSGQQGQQGEQQGGEQQGQQQGEEGQGGEGQQQGEQQGGDLRVALRQERQARQELARRTQLAETRLNAILSRQQGAGGAPEQMPDIGEDPAGYILALEQRLQRFEHERTETTQNQQLDQAISMDEDTFTSIRPDYPQASDYFVQSRAKELLAFHPPQEAQRLMLQEARQIARMAWERGQSVGEAIYSLAQARGYNPGMPQREPYQQQGQQQGGQQQQQGQQQGGRGGPRATDVIDSITRGQQSSRSLSGGTGATAESLNASAILDMDDAEFAQWLGEGGDATKRFATIG